MKERPHDPKIHRDPHADHRVRTLSGTASALGDDLSIAGTPVYGGQSVEIPLSVGDNPVDIAVVNPLSWRRTYVLTLRRAAEITQ